MRAVREKEENLSATKKDDSKELGSFSIRRSKRKPGNNKSHPVRLHMKQPSILVSMEYYRGKKEERNHIIPLIKQLSYSELN